MLRSSRSLYRKKVVLSTAVAGERAVAERGGGCFSAEPALAAGRCCTAGPQDQTSLHLSSAIFRISLSFLGRTSLFSKPRTPAPCHGITAEIK